MKFLERNEKCALSACHTSRATSIDTDVASELKKLR